MPDAEDRRARFTHADAGMARLAELKKIRAQQRNEYIAAGVLPDPERPGALSEASQFRGTCMDMCPEYERLEREVQKELDRLEVYPGTACADPAATVKIYRRPAAGRELPLPDEVRPPEVLRRTLDYLVHTLLPVQPDDPQFARVQAFLWNRTRAIRQDFIVQSERGKIAIECHERIARYHILCLHWKGGVGAEGWSEQQELEQLRKTLRSLIEYYDDSHGNCPNEAEFRAYNLLLHVRDAETLREVEMLPTPVFLAEPVQTALRLRMLVQRSNLLEKRGAPSNTEATPNFFTRFFAELRRPTVSYLMACLAENIFPSVRIGAVKSLARAYMAQHTPLPIAHCTRILGMDSDAETCDFLHTLGVEASDTARINRNIVLDEDKTFAAPFSRSIVEAKRGTATCQEIIDCAPAQPPAQSSAPVLGPSAPAFRPRMPEFKPSVPAFKPAPERQVQLPLFAQAKKAALPAAAPAPVPAPVPAPAPVPVPAPAPAPAPPAPARPPHRRLAASLAEHLVHDYIRAACDAAATNAAKVEHQRRMHKMRGALVDMLAARLYERLGAELTARAAADAALDAAARASYARACMRRAFMRWRTLFAVAQDRAAQTQRLAYVRAQLDARRGENAHRPLQNWHSGLPEPLQRLHSDTDLELEYAQAKRTRDSLWEHGTFAEAIADHVSWLCLPSDEPLEWDVWASVQSHASISSRWLRRKLGIDHGRAEFPLPNGGMLRVIEDAPATHVGLVVAEWGVDIEKRLAAAARTCSESVYVPRLLLVAWGETSGATALAARHAPASGWGGVSVLTLVSDADRQMRSAVEDLVRTVAWSTPLEQSPLELGAPLWEVFFAAVDACARVLDGDTAAPAGAAVLATLTALANLAIRQLASEPWLLPPVVPPTPTRGDATNMLYSLALEQLSDPRWRDDPAIVLLRADLVQRPGSPFPLAHYFHTLVRVACEYAAACHVPDPRDVSKLREYGEQLVADVSRRAISVIPQKRSLAGMSMQPAAPKRARNTAAIPLLRHTSSMERLRALVSTTALMLDRHK